MRILRERAGAPTRADEIEHLDRRSSEAFREPMD